MSPLLVIVGVTNDPSGELVGLRYRRRLRALACRPYGRDWLVHYGLATLLVLVPERPR